MRRAAVVALLALLLVQCRELQNPYFPNEVDVHLLNEDLAGRRDVYFMVGEDVTPSPEDILRWGLGRTVRIRTNTSSRSVSHFFRATINASDQPVFQPCQSNRIITNADPGLYVAWDGATLTCRGWY
jgi:hypothetical protein